MSNLELITRRDEVKFVLQSRNDYLFARDIIRKYDLTNRTNAVLMSAVYKKLNLPDLASWILGDKLQARLQLQLHKYIFGPDTRGV
jgi:7-carboxy-7-deazaguanine synthase